MRIARSSGVLLHLSSLPGGRLGPHAYRFVDWLVEAGQSWWALLPLAPPDATGSPYSSPSAFAAHAGYVEKPEARVTNDELEAFVAHERYWIADWAAFAGGGAIADQVRFECEWGALRRYAAERGVRLFGDVPIYVARGSADVGAHPHLFREGLVAGAPPDGLSALGQLWGNPLYDWSAMRTDGYRWWVERLRRTFALYDLARLDHFRGFVAYWAVPERHRTARRGHFERGPGRAVFQAAERELGPLPLVAEDLGVITPPVERLRQELGFPGMVVMQFAYGGPSGNPYRLENHRRESVVYVGTHDMDTALGWWRRLPEPVRRQTGLPGVDPSWELIDAALSSRAELAVVQAQDVLGLGSEARMNRPGTTKGNWSWRLGPGQLTKRHAARLRALTEASRRLPTS
ncbi:MAG TPA: 4-alpha-glucanotransferase [Gaiellaceae bacterium]|nr:4-alpha-glucanotransferase [Gaiellaceae bacterium]